ncbi:hypothetical protein GCM10028809_16830 [Spirosoma gilvum]
MPVSGSYTFGEPGVGGITVTAYDASGLAVATTTSSTLTSSPGSYTLTGLSSSTATAYRVEFTNIPSGNYEAFRGAGTSSSRSSIRFVNSGATVNFGISSPTDYCQSSPPLAVPCYVSGDPLSATATTALKDAHVLVSVAYASTGTSVTATSLANADEIGSVWGSAYQRETKKLFTAAFLKRHVGLGPAGLGGIYVTTTTGSPTTSLFVDLENAPFSLTLGASQLGTRNLPGSPTTSSTDPNSLSLIGAAGLGGLALSTDGKTLYATDLFNRQLLVMDVGNPASTSLAAGGLSFVALPNPGCTNGVARPFALDVYNGKLYIGVVCTGENGGTSSDLYAYVYAMDEGSTSIPTTPVFNFRLNYGKGRVHTGDAAIGGPWETWATTWSQIHTGTSSTAGLRAARPQPMLTDLGFTDNGDMLLGFTDRGGHQLGYKQRAPTDNGPTATTLINGYIGGDLLRAHYDGSSWVLEKNGTVGSLTSAGANNGQGPGTPTSTTYTTPSGEFYFMENFQQVAGTDTHQETFMGSALSIPGLNQTIVTLMDPTDVFTGGFGWFNNTTGDDDKRAELYSSGDDLITFGKANGLGVIKALCNPAPIQIGNRVWLDSNNNGMQDAGESALAGVVVTLQGTGLASPVSVTTNAAGEYYFSNSTSGTTTTGFSYSLTNLTSGGSYTLTFPTSVSTSTLSSKPNSATGSNADNIDTDASAAGIITFTLGSSGQNNFSYDAGFIPCSFTATAQANGNLGSTTVCQGTSATLTAQVSPTDSYTYAWSAPAGVTLTNGTTATATTSGLPTGTHTFTLTVSSSPVCSTTATVSVVVNALPTPAFTSATICAGQPVTLTASGGTSYTFSNGTTNTTGLLIVSPTSTTAYSVTVANASGCISITTATVTVNQLPTPALTSATICVGQSATLTATGGTSYTFSNGTTNTTGLLIVSPTSTTAYSVTVANASGCISTTSATATVNQLPTPALSSATICAGQSVTLTATGGTSYTFSNGTTNTTGLLVVSPVSTTAYSVTVANASGCKSTTTATVTVNTLPNPTLTSGTICAGQSVTLTATGGTSYTFSNGTTNTTGLLVVSPTSTTAYSVTMANASGCISTTTSTVNVNQLPAATLSSATICVGSSVTLTASGGTSYTFSNGTTNTTGLLVVSPSSTTAYSVTVANGAGCQATATGGVTVNNNPIATLSSATICIGQSVTLTATGGTSYTFSNGTVNSTGLLVVSPTSTTAYSVTASGGTNCSASATGAVTVNSLPTPALGSATICVGQSVTLTASGGTSYTFSNGTTNTTGLLIVSPTSTTAYSVTVANASGCISTTTATVTVNQLPTPALTSATICVGQSVTLTATGGTSYTFSNGTTNTTGLLIVSPTSTTAYSVTVANASGCRSTTTATVNVNALPIPALSSATICVGQSVTLTASGGTSYTFSNGTTNTTGLLVVSPTSTTAYSVTVANASGCKSTTTATVNVNSLPTPALNSATICAGQSVTLTATGGTSYTFSNGTTNTTGLLVVSPVSTTAYSVTVANASGCKSTTSATVTVNSLPAAALSSATICAGSSATLTASGGVSYTFNTGEINTDGLLIVSPSSTTAYSVTVVSSAGCQATATGGVTVNNNPVASLSSATICEGQSVTLVASGGSSFTFSNGTVNTTGLLVVSPASTTAYSVTASGGANCSASATGDVTVNPLPTLQTSVSCNGLATYDVSFTATAGASVSASVGSITGSVISGIPSGQTVTITVTLDGCSITQQLTQNCSSNAASLGDFVWLDSNKDGIQDSGEPGIEGVTAILYINDVASATTVTDATGFYSFTGLTPGNSTSYVVGFSAPTGYTATTPYSGTDRTVDSNADLITGKTESVTLAPGEFNPTLDAGFYIPSAGLGDFVWLDSDKDGIQDSGEPGIAGVTAILYVNGVASATTVTDATGFYSFTGLTPGNSTSYVVGFTAPAGYTATTPYSGTDRTVDSNADLITGKTESVTLAPGEFNPTLDAGFFIPSAGLGDFVWLDLNKDGTQDSGEPGIEGVTAILYVNGVASATTVTDATGFYSFTGLTPGNSTSYVVGFSAPTGYTATTPYSGTDRTVDSNADLITGKTESVTLAPGEFNPTLDAGFFIPSAGLGDFVWLDSNKDGIQDSGEPGIAGVTAILYVNGVASATTVTDATGFYSFTGLTPGSSTSYVVGFTAPAGYTATTPYSGTDRTVDSNADLITGKTESVTLAPGEFNPTLDAGFYIPSAGLGDFVWLDLNKDGIQDSGEPGITGVTAVLYVNGVASATTVTDATGFYSFTGLTPGNSTSYVVGFTAPSGYTATTPYSGTDRSIDSNADLITGKTESVTLAPGEFNPTLDAGFFIPSAGLGDFVWLDTNKDGIQDSGEPGIEGVTAVLYVNGVASATTTTDATGFYSFTGLTPGNSTSYVVGFTAPAGYTATTPYSGTDRTVDSNADLITGKTESVTLAPGEFNPTLDAGFFIPSAGLGDFVWLDLNKDGTQDSGEPGIEGVTAILYVNGVASATTVTDATGFYSFTGLTPGNSTSYVVGFTAPAGYTATTPYSGTDRSIDSNADLITGKTESVTLAPGEFNPTLDAGFYIPSAGLGDFVWLDSDKDGIQDNGEPGITGATAVLYVNGVASATTVTDASGFYSFTGLTPGNSTSYVVGFTAPSGYTATTPYSGTDRSIDSNADLITGKTESVTLAPGEFNPTLDAGFYALPTLLTLDKVVDKSKAQIGDVLSYTIVLTNVGSTTATNVTVRDSTTTGLSYVANSASAPTGTTFTQGYPISLWQVTSLSPGQSLSLTFQAKADSSGILYNTATIPGDTAKVCTSIPVRMCAGDDYAFELTAPAGRSNYKWFRDGVEIVGATTNVLSVTAAGTYSLVVDGNSGQCPDFSCCPFIVEEDTLPNYKAVAVPVSCVGNTPQANGQIVLSGFGSGLTYQYSLGASFNAGASLSGAAQVIPANGLIASNLVNPGTAQSYTVRVYTASGCYKDVTVLLMPTVCGCPADICVPYVISQTKRPQRIGDPR